MACLASSAYADELARRTEARQRIRANVDHAFHAASTADMVDVSFNEETEAVGCLSAIGRTARRMAGCYRTTHSLNRPQPLSQDGSAHAQASVPTAATSAATVSATRSTMSQRLFGVKRVGASVSTPAARLQAAHASITTRTMELEQRAADMRQQAKAAAKSGSKAAALRMLRRAKQIDAQASNMSNAAVAVERQADMLEEAGLQQEVAKALQAGVKDIKQVQKAMKVVESASDSVHEMADDVDEINQLLSSLGENSASVTIDEDELNEELELMMSIDEAESRTEAASDASVTSFGLPIGGLATESSDSSAQPHSEFPRVPEMAPGKGVERVGLLSTN